MTITKTHAQTMKTQIRCGSQTPTFKLVSEYHHTFGPRAVTLFGRWGVRFYPCQEQEMDLFLARDRRNRFACRTICISKPRQNGKSFGVRFYAVWCAAVEGRHVLFTAHRGKTVRKMFKFIRVFILANADLAEKLMPGPDGIYKAAGSEGIYFANGGMIEFATRTDGGARGETYDVIIFDEAQELTDEQYDAVVPTTIASESGDPQKIYLGTPPSPKCAGTVFRGLHDKAHSDGADGMWWIEWAALSVPDMSDHAAVLELVYETNPAMGYRIREDVMMDVIKTATSPDGFAREFLGWWVGADVNANAVITPAEWNACAVRNPSREGDVTYAVRFSPDGKTASLAACHLAEGGVPFVYVVRHKSLEHGLGWLLDLIEPNWQKAKLIVIDGQANAQTLYNRLVEAGVKRKALKLAKSTDATSAYSGFLNAVREGRVTHFGQPALDQSATGSEKRLMGKSGGWGFESTETADATLVESCCWAHWGATTSRRKPGRKTVVRA
jgi:hypothetical protein